MSTLTTTSNDIKSDNHHSAIATTTNLTSALASATQSTQQSAKATQSYQHHLLRCIYLILLMSFLTTTLQRLPRSVLANTTTAASMSTATFKSRSVAKAVLSVEQAEGMGARVRRSIGRPEARNLDPFLMLDEFKSSDDGGFPDHPHRGFETVTYVHPSSKGKFQHEDHRGNKGEIAQGDVQWMTAGRGIVHSEMPVAGQGEIHGFQLWINLSKKDKMCEPNYQELKQADYPHVTKDGVTAHVVAGSALGATSPVYTKQPTAYAHFQMQPNSKLQQPIDKDWNAFVYTISGKAKFNGKAAEGHHTLILEKPTESDGILVETADSPAEFLIISGKPTNEPTLQYGPFVMNAQHEVHQAIRDYQSSSNGFEGAGNWRSKIGERLLGGHSDL